MKQADKENISKPRKLCGFLPELGRYTFCVYIVFAIAMSTVGILGYQHVLLKDYEKLNWLWFLIAVAIGAFCVLIIVNVKRKLQHSKPANKKNSHFFRNFLIIASVVLFALQMCVFFGKFFISGWDVAKIMFKFGDEQYYFNMYPNNLFMHGLALQMANFISAIGLDRFITDVFSGVYPQVLNKISEVESIHPGYLTYAIGYAVFTVIGIVGNNLSVAMIASIVKNKCCSCGNAPIKNKCCGGNASHNKTTKIAVATYIFSAIFIGLMPWILVPYSDIFALFFVTVILWAYVCVRNIIGKFSLLTSALVIGFNIKPTVCFCVIAIIFVELCVAIYQHKFRGIFKAQKNKPSKFKQNANNIIKACASIIICGALCVCIVGKIKTVDVELDEQKQMTMTHFLMMGLNPDTDGFFSEVDVDFSNSYKNLADKQDANITKIKERLSQMGPAGLIKLFANKTMLNYGDATYQWEKDAGPEFYLFKIGNNSAVNWIYNHYAPLAAIMWFIILIGCALSWFAKRNKLANIVAITLLFLSGFLLVFESGSRYLILYTPYFIILSTLGWTNFVVFLQKATTKQVAKQA